MAFNRDRHGKYWRMCANALPDHYISGDASRVFLGFFIIGGLDLLDKLQDVKEDDRKAWADWIYSCQVPDGGFRGFTGTDLQDRRSEANAQWDPANLPNTYFALAALLILGDDLARVDRGACLEWLPKLQRADGSFGEILGKNNSIEGSHDLRHCCCASGVAYILSDPSSSTHRPAFDENRLMNYISSCQSYDGGYGEGPLREPHSGLNYCAIATIELLSRLGGPVAQRAKTELAHSQACIRWMVERQTTSFVEEEEGDSSDDDARDGQPEHGKPFFDHPMYYSSSEIVGFNGRDNKIADTCYCFWNAGGLSILGSEKHINDAAVRLYLLSKTQHGIGGFGKGPGALPDVLHSYLGLAALAIGGRDGIKPVDPALCISRAAVSNLERVVWRRDAATR